MKAWFVLPPGQIERVVVFDVFQKGYWFASAPWTVCYFDGVVVVVVVAPRL